MLQNFEKSMEKYDNFETTYLKVLYYDLPQNYKGTYKSYEYNRVCTIIEGSKHVAINDVANFKYNHSQFILLPPNSSVEMDINEPTKAVVYEISDKLIEDTKNHLQNKYNTDISKTENGPINPQLITPIESPIQRINQFFVSDDPNKAFLIDLSSQELVYNLIKNRLLQDSYVKDLHDPVTYAVQYFMKHIQSNISINEIAFELNMSASNFSSRFKKQTGYTPKEYHNILKIKEAKGLLLSKSVSEVCYTLGFENISYFINLFKKYYGETPKQYSMHLK